VPFYKFFLAKNKAVSRGVMPAGGQHKSTPHQADRDIDISQLFLILDLELLYISYKRKQ
jgi:hypothetical protein